MALRQRILVLTAAALALILGWRAITELSVDAFPDVTNIQVQVATEVFSRSPDEVERLVTIPLETALAGLPGLEDMRSLNKNGLSLITLVFTEDTDIYFARQLVMERLIEVARMMPADVSPLLGPVSSGLGEVYQYILRRDGDAGQLSEQELQFRREIQDWVVRPLLRTIAGVTEVNSQGGFVKQFQVLIDPDRLYHYRISLQDVFNALKLNNANSGGGVLQHYAEQYLIRGVGLIKDVEDIGDIVLKEENSVPLHVNDIAEIRIGHETRSGAVLQDGDSEAVGGIVLMLRGANAKEVVQRVKARVFEINQKGILPDGLKIVPYYDRSDLVDTALRTVTKVLLEGVVLVVLVLFIFLGDVRSSLIVVCTLLLTPLLTFMAMNYLHMSANLMSLGGLAIAIGLMVDGSVVVVENAFRLLSLGKNGGKTRLKVVEAAAQEVATPVLFGVGIIILVFMPLMTLQGMEGKLFAPLAHSIAIALLISLALSLTLSPVLCSLGLEGRIGEHDTRPIAFLKRRYLGLLDWALANGGKVAVAASCLLALTLGLFPFLGVSFIPVMKEGSIVAGIIRPPNISLEESIKIERQAMRLMLQTPGVVSVVSNIGRGESPADPQGQNESTPIATLSPKSEWPKDWTQDTIADALSARLKQNIPGVEIVMSQPIAAKVDEMVTGVRSDVAVKVFGDDLERLKHLAEQVAVLANEVNGARDVRVERVSGQQYLNINIDRQAIARHGLNVSDIHDVIESAIAGKKATEIYQGERRFSAGVRLPEEFRNNVNVIENFMLTSPHGARVRLGDVAKFSIDDGPAQISREMGKRRVVAAINVRGRDLGGFVQELRQSVEQNLHLPEGYYLQWGGQFQNMQRAMHHLQLIVPITVAAIFFLLFMLFKSLRFAALIILVLPFASMGGVVTLYISGEYLSVPASVGFIALWGIAVLNGVVLISYLQKIQDSGLPLLQAVRLGCEQRFRPVMMTATVAMLGLLPFLFSSDPGSEVQKPLAIVVIGGLISSTLLTLLVLPVLYVWLLRRQGAS